MYEVIIKRLLDVVISTLSLIFLLPLLIVLAICIRCFLGSPILFKQYRPGLNEKVFVLYKFRTMTDAKDNQGVLLPDSKRLTSFGKFLRASSLDELPELFNILMGDMSLIGPRPLLVEYLPYYFEHERMRHSIRPGLTGLAQVSGRNNLNWSDRFHKDIEYIQNISFTLDLKILYLTLKKVVLRNDVNVDTNSEGYLWDYREKQR